MWISLLSGKRFEFDHINPDDILIEDIAKSLSQICRWGGHIEETYSVAQHSVTVSILAPAKFALVGLMHDAAEAYIGDIVRPLKAQIPQIREVEDRIMRVIADKYGFEWPMPPEVKALDDAMCATENAQLRTTSNWKSEFPILAIEIHPWQAEVAERAFLRRFDELTAPKIQLGFNFSEKILKNLERRDEVMRTPLKDLYK